MSQYTDATQKTFTAASALSQYRRVRLGSSDTLEYASGTSTDALGTLTRDVLAAGDEVAVRAYHAGFSSIFIASGAISKGAAVYAAANGKVAGSGTVLVGEALETVTTDGDHIEVMPSTASILGSIARSSLTQEDLEVYNVPFDKLVVHDAMATKLTATANNDDMGIVTGTPGTDAPTVQGVDFGGTSTDEKCSFEFTLPPEYVDGETVTLRVKAGALTTVSDGTLTLDAEVWKVDPSDGTVGSDICATAAQSINSLTVAAKSFTITPTGLVPGDKLIVRLSFAGSDTGNLGVMAGLITEIALLLDIKG